MWLINNKLQKNNLIFLKARLFFFLLISGVILKFRLIRAALSLIKLEVTAHNFLTII